MNKVSDNQRISLERLDIDLRLAVHYGLSVRPYRIRTTLNKLREVFIKKFEMLVSAAIFRSDS